MTNEELKPCRDAFDVYVCKGCEGIYREPVSQCDCTLGEPQPGYMIYHVEPSGSREIVIETTRQPDTLDALLEKVPEKTQYKDEIYTDYGCPKSKEDGWNACREALQNALREVG